MGDAPDMPELEEDAAAGAVDGIGHAPPAVDLFRRVYPRRTGIADALRADLRGFGDRERGARPLRVIRGVERLGNVAGAGAVARHRRHDHPVGRRDGAERDRACEPRGLGHGAPAGQPAPRKRLRAAV